MSQWEEYETHTDACGYDEFGPIPRVIDQPKKISFRSVNELKAALIAAKDAHTAFERENGPDEDWPLWYAKFIAESQSKKHLGEAV